MKMMRGFIIVIIMAAMAVGIAGARASWTPESATRHFVEEAARGDIDRMTWAMTSDSAALLVLYGDANRIRNFFSGRGSIARIEQVSNNGSIAITQVTFGNGSTEQFRLVYIGGDWWVASQIVRRN